MTLEEKVKQIIVENLNRPESEVTMDADFVNDLGADSLDTAELMMAIEDTFKDHIGDNIPESEAEQFKTVGSVVEYLRSKGVPDQM